LPNNLAQIPKLCGVFWLKLQKSKEIWQNSLKQYKGAILN
jgi:hypothetical protein